MFKKDKSLKHTSDQNAGSQYSKGKASTPQESLRTSKKPGKSTGWLAPVTGRTIRYRHELKYHISESKAEAIALI